MQSLWQLTAHHGDGEGDAGPHLQLNDADPPLPDPTAVTAMVMWLPELCIQATVEQYRNRLTADATSPKQRKKYFLTRANAMREFKNRRLATFWNGPRQNLANGRLLKSGVCKMAELPYDILPAYVRAHGELRSKCGLTGPLQQRNKNNLNIMRQYRLALKLFYQQESAVAGNLLYCFV